MVFSFTSQKNVIEDIARASHEAVAEVVGTCQTTVLQNESSSFVDCKVQVGGDFVSLQNLNSMVNCVQDVEIQATLMSELQSKVNQVLSKEEGLPIPFQNQVQENITKVEQHLKTVSDQSVTLDCDAAIRQASELSCEGSQITVGGNWVSSQAASVQSSCQQIASLSQDISTIMTSDLEQSSTIEINELAAILPFIVIGVIGCIVLFVVFKFTPIGRVLSGATKTD